MTVDEKQLARTASPPAMDIAPELEVSVVMPCLNEADTIGTCIEKAFRALRENNISGEVIIADNGSTDDSSAIATRLGARVVPVTERGYGSALMGGIAAARGKYIIMGDADDSYDFLEIPSFVKSLRQGFSACAGMPSAGWRWNDRAWCDAVSSSLVGKSHVLPHGTMVVCNFRSRHLLRYARFYEGTLWTTGSALHREWSSRLK